MSVITGAHGRVAGMAGPVVVERMSDVGQCHLRSGPVHPVRQDPRQRRDPVHRLSGHHEGGHRRWCDPLRCNIFRRLLEDDVSVGSGDAE